MNTLRELQNQFQHYLLTGENDFPEQVVGTEAVSVETRLRIYSNAYRIRLIDALAYNYPILSAYLGSDEFAKIAGDYTDQFPSPYRSVRWFGDHFADFLKNLDNNSLFLSELAEFEWLQTLVFDAADSEPLKMEDVANIPAESWGDMRFRVHPSVHCISLSWNTVHIWQAVFDQQSPDQPVESPIARTWILWRKELINYFRSLTESEAWAMNAVLQQFTFGELCEGLCDWFDEHQAGVEAASLLKKWIHAGLLVEVMI